MMTDAGGPAPGEEGEGMVDHHAGRAAVGLERQEAERLGQRHELQFGRSGDFADPSLEWRRLFSELLGTFFLVLVGAGGAVAGLWSSPISGASLNPARSLGPDMVLLDFADY